jgi:hypothetical protein
MNCAPRPLNIKYLQEKIRGLNHSNDFFEIVVVAISSPLAVLSFKERLRYGY